MSNGKLGGGLGLLGGAGLGAALMYLFDPEQGSSRRDEVARAASDVLGKAGKGLSGGWEELAHHAKDLSEKISEHAGHVGAYASKATAAAGDRVSDLADSASDYASRASDYASRLGGQTSDAASQAAGGASDAAAGARDYLSDVGSRLADRARELGSLFAGKASDAADAARGYAGSARGSAKSYSKQAKGYAKQARSYVAEDDDGGIGATGYTVGSLGLVALAAGAWYLLDKQHGAERRDQLLSRSQEYLHEVGSAFNTTGQYIRRQYDSTVSDVRARLTGHMDEADDAGRESFPGDMNESQMKTPSAGSQGGAAQWPLSTNDTTRLGLAVAGGALGFYGATRRDWVGLGVGVLGLGLLGAGLMKYDYQSLGQNLADGAGDWGSKAGEYAGKVKQLGNAEALRGAADRAKSLLGSASGALSSASGAAGEWAGGARDKAASLAGQAKDWAGSSAAPTTFQRSLEVNAPVAKVFEFWSNYENFPSFMSNLTEVKDLGNGRSHWEAKGPAGTSFAWDAAITQYVTNEVLAWESVEGSTVQNKGSVRFADNGHGGTKVDIDLSYNPPAGQLGHAVAKLFGSDPGSSMDQDLHKVKERLEGMNQTQNA